ncbi:MAG: LacI family DNA-binding transcriptional regulator [Capsulimonadaceae bacterium]|nr:LacI family DNA-binding transcriptional regulator [Capsulimonadaceae bacterium]
MNTVEEIAKRAGVSAATVSRTFRSPEKLSQDTANRILQIADQLKYAPKPRRPRRKTMLAATEAEPVAVTTIGFLFFAKYSTDIYSSHSFYGEILHGVQDQATALGLDVKFAVVPRYSAPDEMPAMISSGALSGLLLVGAAPPHVLGFYSSAAKHIVNVDHIDPAGEHDGVLSDGIGGANMALEHLWSLGHRRIAYVTPESEAVTFRERYRGYQLFLLEHGLRLDPELVLTIGADENPQAKASGLFDGIAPPTAVFAANDETASWVLQACHNRSIDVPGQVSIVGFDDVYLAQHVWPPLTSVHVDIVGLGREAVVRLYERMCPRVDVPRLATPANVRLRSHLVERKSTGVVRAEAKL